MAAVHGAFLRPVRRAHAAVDVEHQHRPDTSSLRDTANYDPARGPELDLDLLCDYYRLFDREAEFEKWIRESSRR